MLDAVPFVAAHVLPRLTVTRRLESLALHPTCSSRRMGIDAAVLALARAVAEDVVVPTDWQCCAFAGDRGLLHPELTASATRAEAAEVNRRSFDAYASVNRTCEIGMTRATGQPYRHLLELLEEATREDPLAWCPVSRRTRWGMVETGGISRTTAGDLRLTENVDFVAVASRQCRHRRRVRRRPCGAALARSATTICPLTTTSTFDRPSGGAAPARPAPAPRQACC